MEENNKNEYIDKKGMVHFVLSHSYLVFLFCLILGVVFDIIFKVSIFDKVVYQYVGFILIVFGSIIIYWSQNSSKRQKRFKEKNQILNFSFGPYKFLRNPTHFGLLIMVLGFALLINSLFSIIFSILGYFFSKFYFLKKQENILLKKYGEEYLKYKKKVKNWI